MAAIEKRGDSYRIIVFCGYDITGKQIRHRMTWTPPEGMTQRQIEKELSRVAVRFEDAVESGTYIDSTIKFADFTELWMRNYAEKHLKPRTVSGYVVMLPQINKAIGHLQLRKILPQHLIAFYNNLSEVGIRRDKKYLCAVDFKALLKKHKETKVSLSQKAGIGITVLDSVTRGQNISSKSAEKISVALDTTLSKIFTAAPGKDTLSGTTILKHHRLISSVLSTAVHWQIIASNPCSRVKPPRADTPEAAYLDDDEAVRMLELLDAEPIRFRAMIQVLLFTGIRRGELMGLEWGDINTQAQTIDISRSALYVAKQGIIEDTPKTKSSSRVIKVSPIVFDVLKEYEGWQIGQRLKVGDQWQDSKRIFTNDFGRPLHPDTLTRWFHKFVRQHEDLPTICVHSLRHTNATLQIANGIPITTIAKRLGHTTPATTTKVYAHAIRSADEAAAETLQNLLTPKNKSSKTG